MSLPDLETAARVYLDITNSTIKYDLIKKFDKCIQSGESSTRQCMIDYNKELCFLSCSRHIYSYNGSCIKKCHQEYLNSMNQESPSQ